jgi:hypothetical protein
VCASSLLLLGSAVWIFLSRKINFRSQANFSATAKWKAKTEREENKFSVPRKEANTVVCVDTEGFSEKTVEELEKRFQKGESMWKAEARAERFFRFLFSAIPSLVAFPFG